MNRDVSIDYIRGIAILLVVVGHFLQGNFISYSDTNSNSFGIFEVIYSFHMPLFFILSGYVSAIKKDDISSLSLLYKYLKKKAILLLLPMIIWKGLLYPIVNHKEISIQSLINDFLHPFPLWFLQTLFIIFVGFALYRYLSSKNNRSVLKLLGGGAAVIVIEALSLAVDKRCLNLSTMMSILLYPSFFVIGYIFSNFSINEKLLKNDWLIVFAFVVMLFGMIQYEFPGSTLINRFYKYLASIGFFFVAKKCFQTNEIPKIVSKYLTMCSKHSLSIYCIHFLFIWDIYKFSTDSLGLLFFLSLIVSVVISSLIIFFAEFLSPLKYVSIFLFGRVSKKV